MMIVMPTYLVSALYCYLPVAKKPAGKEGSLIPVDKNNIYNLKI
jgi:hypothetical protein